MLALFFDKHINIYLFAFSLISKQWDSKSFLMEDKNQFMLHIQYNGSLRRQGIRSHGIDQVIPEYCRVPL